MIVVIDATYLKDEKYSCILCCEVLCSFAEKLGKIFPKYLAEFNNWFREVKKYKLSFEDCDLIYILLAAANLSDDYEWLHPWSSMKWKTSYIEYSMSFMRGEKMSMLDHCQWRKSAYIHDVAVTVVSHHGFNQGSVKWLLQRNTTNYKGFNQNQGGMFRGRESMIE